MGKSYGVALLSEALVERFSPREVAELQDVDRDAQGNIRVTEIDLGRKVKNEVQMRLEQRGIKVTIVDKTIGYELRCARRSRSTPIRARSRLRRGELPPQGRIGGRGGHQGGGGSPRSLLGRPSRRAARAGVVLWTSRPRAIRWRASTWCVSDLATSRTRRGSLPSLGPPASAKTPSAPGSNDSHALT